MQVKQKYGTLEAGHVWLGLHRLCGCRRQGPGLEPEWLGQDRVGLVPFHRSIRVLGPPMPPAAQALLAAMLAREPPDPACAHPAAAR